MSSRWTTPAFHANRTRNHGGTLRVARRARRRADGDCLPRPRSERHRAAVELSGLGIPLLPSHYPMKVERAGLSNTYTNYQGPDDVPRAILESVPVGSVLSQRPAPGTEVPPGTTVYIAVRKA